MKNKRTVSEEVQARVYNALLVGKENALNRDELVSKIGESDRDIRTAIEILRHNKERLESLTAILEYGLDEIEPK